MTTPPCPFAVDDILTTTFEWANRHLRRKVIECVWRGNRWFVRTVTDSGKSLECEAGWYRRAA